jgi:hypothetical protein
MFRRPASLHRVAVEGRSPCFFGTIRTLRLPATRPAALGFPSLGGTTAVSQLRSHAAGDTPPRGRGVGWGGHPCTAVCPWKWLDLPSSRRGPCRRAHAPSTPEEPDGTRLVAPSDAATGMGTAVASSTGLSRLNRMARRLAVYASHRTVARRHARLASGCAATLCRVGLAPTGSPSERFQLRVRITYHPPLASLLGAIPFSSASGVHPSPFENAPLVRRRPSGYNSFRTCTAFTTKRLHGR